ncbi:MAG TPA: DUF4410 domain-containing protein [Burkholderiaceae bacterium]|nr:DUF4410 domain-containing protein [Burkholderiaceae bacterium]
MMQSMNSAVRRAASWAATASLVLLTGCAATVKQDARVDGDVSRLEGVTQVVALLSPDAAKQQADNPQFNRDELATRVRTRLEAKGLTAPAATHRVEIVVTDIRVRGAFAAIMFGFMAGDDHVTGRVRVMDPAGRALRSFEIHASYAFGGVAGGQDGVRMNWMYDKFADLAAAELEKIIVPPRAGAGSIAPASVAAPAPGPVATPAPLVAASAAAIDNAEAVPVSERGRSAYREWLTRRKPRAFVVSDNGYFYAVWGTKPPDPMEPSDPTERAMKRCQDAARPNCTIYAVDDRVVYTRPGPSAAR